MSDPVGERLRSFYGSIQRDPPAGLEVRVARAIDTAQAARRTGRPWRPLFAFTGFAAVVAIVAAAALVFANLRPAPVSSASPSVGPTSVSSASPSGSSSPIPAPSPVATMPEPTPSTPGLIASPSAPPLPTAASDQFSLTGSMTVGRDGPTATRLKNGKVLVVGGKVASGSVATKTVSAELYDPASGMFTATGSMADARWGHTATLLNDGRVLVVGGADLSDGFNNLKSAEIYDPGTGKFTVTGSMAVGRADHTATLLADGRVLIAGGTNSIGLDSAEIYDPATGRFSPTGSMTVARQDQTATRLQDGRVLIAGGTANGVTGPFGVLASAEIYDPSTGKFTATGSMSTPRQGPTATLLPDGTVMVIGGLDQDSALIRSAESYDPAARTFGGAGAWGFGSTATRTAVLLSDGQTLLTIGQDRPGANAETWDGGHNNFYSAGSTTLNVACQTATLLPSGLVLLLGGTGADGKPAAIATLYQLGSQN
ncbi:MAG: Kelch repeat-containing protein [Candidatus Limnocylindrales bacterium]